jgi:flagellar biosynthesis protein FliP
VAQEVATISGFLTMMPFIKQLTRSAVSPIVSTDEKQDEVFQQQNDNIKACKIFKTRQTNSRN